MVVLTEGCVHFAGIHLLRSFEEQAVFIKRHFDDVDVVGFCQPRHKVSKRRVESSSPAGGDHVGRKRTRNDLFHQNTTRVGHLERVEGMLLKMASNGIGNLVGKTVHIP